ncbi:hypothetical protein NEOLEDRAFT_1175504 [Neolentinus lepideus HHB14362 ss-1]|uniref:Zinc-finger domain-containing protein n=1 Tax=Neolentinus lepideus HHB14362 ss-1 TaxID=1314782 RepID=A0A165V624_9AGAM|nr:hypothetical protein NEOLEDRAFT_1175504 [Neolentinus lepideus HHB14362 ss-1]
MTPTTTPSSSVRRRSQAFVEIPPSPLHTFSTAPSKAFVSTPSSRHKENTFVSVDADMAESVTRTSPRKRKLSTISSTNNTVAALTNRASQPTPKKAKVTPSVGRPVVKPKKTVTTKTALKPQPSNANEEFPDGFFYCHQCNKKRDNSLAIQCTFYSGDNSRHARCRAKYCKICLKNRYGDDFDEIKSRGENSRPKGHVKGSGYIFQCRDICNCRNCRRSKGLEPTGNLTLAAKRTGAESAAAILGENPSAQGVLPGKGQQVEPQKKSAKPKAPKEVNDKAEASRTATAKSKAVTNAATDKVSSKPKAKAAAKPKPVPAPKWKAVETILDLHQAEDRFFIREFVLRFAGLFDIGKANLEELDDIDADYVRGTSHSHDEEEELCAWVSEPCVKAMIVGLLDVIAGEAESNTKKAIKGAVKEIRNSGANLTKIWATLAVLRDSVSSGPHYRGVDFPDPLPPPASAVFRSTRSGLGAGKEIQIAASWQLIPVVLALMEALVPTKAVKEEIEKGMEKIKEVHKECKEEVRKDNEKWEGEKSEKKADIAREKRAAHKQRVADLEQAFEVASTSYLPRSGPLGKDADGRVYWLLPPGAGEREFGFALLADATKAKVTKKGMLSLEDRRTMRRWTWFVAVWGKRPPKDAVEIVNSKKKQADQEEEEDDDDDREKWWGFWEPKEIKTLADWLAVKAGLDSGKVSAAMKDGKARSRDTSINQSKSPSTSLSALPDTDIEMVDASSRASTPLSELSDGDDALSDLPDEEEDEGGVFAEGPPSKGSMKNLVKGLRDYADTLAWRAGKWQKPLVEEEKADGVKGKKP